MLAVGFATFSGCGGDSTVPIGDIPPDKKLVDLNSDERQGVCDWAMDVVHQKLPSDKANCNGIPLNFSCGLPQSADSGCEGTVAQWQVCFPNFMDRIAADPCLVLDLGLSTADLSAFVNETPGCEGLGPCSYTTQ
jgi:hypothetical protein